MKKIITVFLHITCICLQALTFYPITDTEFSAILDLESIAEYDFEIVEITTVRNRHGIETTEIWKGIRITELIRRWTHLRNWDYEFIAEDNYFVRLNIEQIANFNPIIALERNSVPIPEGQWRLVSQNMPAMLWVSNISEIHERPVVLFQEPERVFQLQSVLSHVRLHSNPHPFEGKSGYRFSDIISIINNTTPSHVRLLSTDKVEQILPYDKYLQNAYLIVNVDEDEITTYSIQSVDMPYGMWQKFLLQIQTNEAIIDF